MSKKHDDFRFGIMFTREQTKKINEMAKFTNFFDLSEFIYHLVDKEYSNLTKQHGPFWSEDFK